MRGEQPWRANRARVLRSRPISAEARLWSRLRNRQLAGHKFVRQAWQYRPLGAYPCIETMEARTTGAYA